MVDWIKARWFVRHYTAITWGAVLIVIAIVAGQIIRGHAESTFWLIWGGNGSSGDGNGGGAERDQLVAGGWTDYEHSFQITWKADIAQNTKAEAAAAMPDGHAAYDRFCHSHHCILAGFSLGNTPNLQLASEVGQPPSDTYLFGAPQVSTGIFHAWYVQAGGPFPPGAQFWLEDMGGLDVSTALQPGMQNFYDTKDPYNDTAPQCSNLAAVGALNVQTGHYIVSKDQADSSHIWTGPDGVVMHEVNYVAPPGLPLSGSDPSPLWAGCPPGGWQDSNGTVPGAGGGLPIPGGSPIPSVGGNMPSVPALPGVPQPGG